MSFISNDPSFWPLIDFYRVNSYYIVASSIVVVYDWALTFGQEFDLVWRKRWSLMTVLYLGVRYIGLLYSGIQIASNLHSVQFTDVDCTIVFITQDNMSFVANTMLGIVMVTRLHAMYQRSRKMLIFLVLIFSAVTVTCGVIIIIQSKSAASGVLVLSGNYYCDYTGDNLFLSTLSWIFGAVWEVVALSLAVWIAIKHFREAPTGQTIEDCITALIKAHVLYFAAFAAVACLVLGTLSPNLSASISAGTNFYSGVLQISSVVEMFILGPRLILSIRQHNAKVVDNSDEATAMTSIAFRERTQMSTSGGDEP